MLKFVKPLLIAFTLTVAIAAQQTSGPVRNQSPFTPLNFLVSAWEADAVPGNGTGHFTFEYDLDGAILVRRNHAEYPASASRAAIKHDDLLVIFPDPETQRLRATYWDNENHFIRYTVTVTAEGVDFVSDPQLNTPGFRLRYKKLGADRMAVDFEIAPPGKPGAFAPYLSGTAHRTLAAK